jgi:hypothetical protein
MVSMAMSAALLLSCSAFGFSWLLFVTITEPCWLLAVVHYVQTKGVRGIASIETDTAAWIAAVSAVGAAIVGSAILWPVMRSKVRK